MSGEFGINLEKMMKERKLSARSLAKELGEPYKTVQEWVGVGGRVPRNPDLLKKLADYFDVSIHALLFGEEDPRGLIGAILEKTEIHTGIYEITVRKVKTK